MVTRFRLTAASPPPTKMCPRPGRPPYDFTSFMSGRAKLRLAARQPHARWVVRMNEAAWHRTVRARAPSMRRP
jgi:hypothetical protein